MTKLAKILMGSQAHYFFLGDPLPGLAGAVRKPYKPGTFGVKVARFGEATKGEQLRDTDK